ncbi:hypothetical protein F5Y11DRAFT_348964 [Daldinia sp. FL1419]|nr:hypothetical protein F5Y11DRAFT_348964 [Daldinia sp. FL1419]
MLRETQIGKLLPSFSATEDTAVVAIPVNGWVFAFPTGWATNGSNNCDSSVLDALANHIAKGNTNYVAPGGGGISEAAAAGIGVGVSLGVTGLAALGAGLFMMYRNRKASRKEPPTTDIVQFANSCGKETPSLSERYQYSSYERDNWNASTPCPPPLQTASTHTPARTVPHGEMECSPYQSTNEITTTEIGGAPYQEADGGIMGSGFMAPPHYHSEEEAGRRMELEGGFYRNAKVSLSTPWLAEARAVPPSSSSSSHYHPPH